MNDAPSLFDPALDGALDGQAPEAMVRAAVATVDAITDRFNARKVHLFVDYTRNRADGTVLTRHRNLWIVTLEAGRWGIKQRSH